MPTLDMALFDWTDYEDLKPEMWPSAKKKGAKPPCLLSQKSSCKALCRISIQRCAEGHETTMVGKERSSIMLIVFCAQFHNVSHFGCIIGGQRKNDKWRVET